MGDRRKKALEFYVSARGQYIVAQALYYGIRTMKSVEPEVMQEKSNIADMEYIREHLFGTFPDMLFQTQSLAGSKD
jgi:hypothetical protein